MARCSGPIDMHDKALEHASGPSSVPVGAVPTIGRERELAQIRRLIADAARGSVSILFLDGEVGIGKSRLLSDAMQCMRDVGGVAVLGRCLDERGMPPLFPW